MLQYGLNFFILQTNDHLAPTPIPPPPAPTVSPQPTKFPITSAPYSISSCEPFKNTVNFGYYEEWSEYRQSNCNPTSPNDIDVAAFGYTHLAFSFAGISSSGLIEPYNGNNAYIAKYTQFNSLKDTNPTLKTLIAIGGKLICILAWVCCFVWFLLYIYILTTHILFPHS